MNDSLALMTALASGSSYDVSEHFGIAPGPMMRIMNAIKELKKTEEEEAKKAKVALDAELKRRRNVILAATYELYPDKEQVPVLTEVQKLLASRGDFIPIDSVRVQARKLRATKRWIWKEKQVKVVNPIKSFVYAKVKNQPLRFQINQFVRSYYTEKKSEPSVALIANVLRRGLSTVEAEVIAMRQADKWPVSLKG